MGFLTPDRKRNEERPGGESGLYIDLDEKICAVCRRSLPPWQATCPDDQGQAVRPVDLPPSSRPPAHLLDDDGVNHDASGNDEGMSDFDTTTSTEEELEGTDLGRRQEILDRARGTGVGTEDPNIVGDVGPTDVPPGADPDA